MSGKGQKGQQTKAQTQRSPGEEQDLAEGLGNLDTSTDNSASATDIPRGTGPPPATADPNIWIQLLTGAKSPTHGILAWAMLTSDDFGLRTTEGPLELQGEAAQTAGFLDAMRNEKLTLPWMGSGAFRCNGLCKYKPERWVMGEGQIWDWDKGIDIQVNVEKMKSILDEDTKALCNFQHVKTKTFSFKIKKDNRRTCKKKPRLR